MANERPRILVCGGRKFINKQLLYDTLDFICRDYRWELEPDTYGNTLPNVVIIAGGAKGADTLAVDWAITNYCNFIEYHADWDTYKKKAGHIRNQQMIDEGKPDLVIAFPTKESRGTWDMVRRAKNHGIETIIVEE